MTRAPQNWADAQWLNHFFTIFCFICSVLTWINNNNNNNNNKKVHNWLWHFPHGPLGFGLFWFWTGCEMTYECWAWLVRVILFFEMTVSFPHILTSLVIDLNYLKFWSLSIILLLQDHYHILYLILGENICH